MSGIRVAVVILSCMAPEVHAQGVEEVVVTARKTEESLQEVPLSITAFGAEQLQAQGIRNNYDLASFTVNFNTAQQLGRRDDRPVIRGQVAPATRGEPNASYFIDGAFVSGSVSTAMLGAVERVEILRGPQSAQFGRATFAGAINYVTRQPTDEFEGWITSKAGSNDDYQLGGWISGPIIRENLAFFAAANWEKFGGEWRNELERDSATGANALIDPPQEGDTSRLGGIETKELTGKLLFTPGDSSIFTLKYSYSEGDDDHFAPIQWTEMNCSGPNQDPAASADELFQPLPTASPSNPDQPDLRIPGNEQVWNATEAAGRGGAYCGELNIEGRPARVNLPDFRAGVQGVPGLFDEVDVTAAPSEPGTRRKQHRFLLQYDQGFGDWDLITRAAYNTDDFEQTLDLDRMEGREPTFPFFLTGLFHIESNIDVDDWSGEMRLASPVDKAVRSQVGVYYFESERKEYQRHFPGPGLAQYSTPRITTTTNTAVFGSVGFDLADQWTLDIEARWARDDKDLEAFTAGEIGGDPGAFPVETDLSIDAFTPRITLRFLPTDDLMLYGLVAKGNKPGDFNTAYFSAAALNTAFPGSPIVDTDDPRCDEIGVSLGTEDAIACGKAFVEEEEAWTYEVGTKTTWLDRRVMVNLSAFYIDWENQGQFQTANTERAITGATADTIVVNAGRSRSIGLELETNFVVMENLMLIANYGYVDAEYIEFNSDLYATITGINDPDGTGNVAGFRLPNNPEHSVVFGAVATAQASASLEAFLRLDVAYETERMVDETNFSTLDDRTLINLRFGFEADSWTLTTYVTNLLDDNTPTAASSFINFLPDALLENGANSNLWTMNPNRGRNYGLELLYRFGAN